jgi:Secretion system C-terminal sorting domain
MKNNYLLALLVCKVFCSIAQKQGDWVDNVNPPYVYTQPVSIKILPKTDPKRAYDFPAQTNITGAKTGFFHTQKINNKWWLVDPNGYAFYMNCMLGGVGHRWGENKYTYTTNMEAKYGTQEKLWDAQVARLKSWDFNSWGIWGVEPLAAPMPTVRQLEPMSAFTAWQSDGLTEYKIIDGYDWHDIANVFHPDWEAWIDNYIKQQVKPFENSPWIIGYQVGNELDWNLLNDVSALSAWKRPRLDEAKKAWIDVAKCHGDIAYFNNAWNTQFQNFDAVGTTTNIPLKAPTAEAEAMCVDFNNLIVDKFLGSCKAALKKHAPNHLLLGVRQHCHDIEGYFNGGFWETMGEHCDVISLNYYATFVDVVKGVPTKIESHLRGLHNLAKCPIMTSEWHPIGDVTENVPYIRYNYYQKYLASLDFMVGTQFFQMEDWDQNRAYGAVNINDVPHADIEKAFKETNPLLQSIHTSGKTSDYTYEKTQGFVWKVSTPTKLSAKTGNKFTNGDLELEVVNSGIKIKKSGIDFGSFTPVLKINSNNAIRYPQFNKAFSITKITETTYYDVVHISYGAKSTSEGYDLTTFWELWVPNVVDVEKGNWFGVRMVGASNPSQLTYNLDNIYYSIYTKETAKPMTVWDLDINGWETLTSCLSLFDISIELGENRGQEAWIDTNGGQHTTMGWIRPTTMVGAQGFSELGPMAIVMVTPSTHEIKNYVSIKSALEKNCFSKDPNFVAKQTWEIDPSAQALLKKCLQEKTNLKIEDFADFSNQIVIYPNPTNTSFKVTGLSNSYSYELYNMQGQLVGKNENQNAESTINTNTLPEGIYGIRIKSGQNVYNKKVVVSEK